MLYYKSIKDRKEKQMVWGYLLFHLNKDRSFKNVQKI